MLHISNDWLENLSVFLPGFGVGADCNEDEFKCDGFADDDGDRECDCDGCEKAEVAKGEKFERIINDHIAEELHRVQSGYYDDQMTGIVPRQKKKIIGKTKKKIEKRSEQELDKIRKKAKFWNQKKIKVGCCSDDLLGKSVKAVQQYLENQAFTNIKLVGISNKGRGNKERSEKVKEVLIAGRSFFLISDTFPYDAEIYIRFYEKVRIPVPISSDEAKGQNIQVIKELLQKNGFIAITARACSPGLLKWRIANGSIKSITIDGFDFTEEQEFMPDAKIEIVYYAKRGALDR